MISLKLIKFIGGNDYFGGFAAEILNNFKRRNNLYVFIASSCNDSLLGE